MTQAVDIWTVDQVAGRFIDLFFHQMRPSLETSIIELACQFSKSMDCCFFFAIGWSIFLDSSICTMDNLQMFVIALKLFCTQELFLPD